MSSSVTALFDNEVFLAAMAEIEALGFRVSPQPFAGAEPYAVIGGRSNARWWLVPLTNRQVAVSGLALFQPVIPSAKVLKGAAVVASNMGLSSLWARKRVYVGGVSQLAEFFGGGDLAYAFFTGTDSPHRKVAVQVMGRDGRIKGFAKVACNPAVKPLLEHEAATLDYLHTLDLRTALIPKVLFCGEIGGAGVLVTDTLKTARTRTVTKLTGAHLAFLKELAEKTAVPGTAGTDWVVPELRRQYAAVADRLPMEWRERLERALGCLEGYKGEWGARSLSHGDFTPWNTFFVGGKLYVFDWEYASNNYPPAYDLLNFSSSSNSLACRSECASVLEFMQSDLVRYDNKRLDNQPMFLAHATSNCLFYLNRESRTTENCLSIRNDVKVWMSIDRLAN